MPAGLDAFVMACLRKDPDARPRHAGEAMALLDALYAPDAWTNRDAARWWCAHLPEIAEQSPVEIKDREH